MSIAKPFTFVANTYAKASEVNADFDTVYAQVNSNISAIAQNATDIDNLENNKANINGDYTQRFAVANPTTGYDAVNKQSLMNAIGNSIDYINGLTISKDSGSPEDTIIVSAGSCYNSTHSVVLSLSDATSKQNDNQAANATYYMYIIGDSTGATIDILISTSSVNPSLPAGYTLYRMIGNYTTNGNNNIDLINSYGVSSNIPTAQAVIVDSYVNGKSWYRVWSDGWIEQGITTENVVWGNNDYKEYYWLKPFTSGESYTCVAVSNLAYVGNGVTSGDIAVEATAYDKVGIGNGASNAFGVRIYACGY